MKVLILIPARYASTRFPGKPLAEIGGRPVIQHVFEKASAVTQDVYVATDDTRIFSRVEEFGGKAVMTSIHHRSGTDRCFETLAKSFDHNADIFDSNKVKVVCSARHTALYFSRSAIPFCRGGERENWLTTTPYYKHIGMYAYRPEVLQEITALPQGVLEKAESLEQLRWLENGYTIAVRFTDHESVGIDTPEDLERANQIYHL